ncbi:MAG TPA: histone deacetylase [Planctomycetaceae bacterium]|nr:histone deacetylase [Planctomycetaceae bacterium]
MRVYYCDHFELPLPTGHRFPIGKYRLTRELVAAELGRHIQLEVADAPSYEQLARVHHRDYLQRVMQGQLSELEQRRIGFPWSEKMVQRSLRSTGATLAAAKAALSDGIAVHLSGGTHHAFADSGQGFCVFNDVAVAAMELLDVAQSTRILVLDLDVHQGNGTASIFANEPRVTTVSMHGDKNFPYQKTDGDIDIPLPDGTDDDLYQTHLRETLDDKLELEEFDFAFFIAGADPYEGDRMGRLSLSQRGLEQRDQLVFSKLANQEIPCAVVMGGGYAEIEAVARIHANTVGAALAHFQRISAAWPKTSHHLKNH